MFTRLRKRMNKVRMSIKRKYKNISHRDENNNKTEKKKIDGLNSRIGDEEGISDLKDKATHPIRAVKRRTKNKSENKKLMEHSGDQDSHLMSSRKRREQWAE